ncbi:MAG: CRISPR-associated protein Csx20 [Calditrichia bacterium]
MRKMFVLLNHTLTEKQIREARDVWKVDSIVETPEQIRTFWSQIDAQMEFNKESMAIVLNWLEENSGENDLVLIQGDFGAVFYLVDYCFHRKLVPVYATTRRTSREEMQPDGTVRKFSLFDHVRFRQYRRYIV